MFRPTRFVHIFFFFNDTATTEIYTLSLHDALPISNRRRFRRCCCGTDCSARKAKSSCCNRGGSQRRSEEHTSELQSQSNLVCRLLLEKKNSSCDAHALSDHYYNLSLLPRLRAYISA